MRWSGAVLIVALLAEAVHADSILFTENFDGASLPNSLTYESTGAAWLVDAGHLVADNLADTPPPQVATALSNVGFALTSEGLTYSVDVGRPSTGNPKRYHVALVFGDYIALFHPGYSASGTDGFFRLENFSAPVVIDSTDMGFVPALDTLHRVVAVVVPLGPGLKIDISITGLGTDAQMHTFSTSVVTSAALGTGRIGVAMRGQDFVGDDAFFDNLEVRGPSPVLEPSGLPLLAVALGGVGLYCRRKFKLAG